ncbi:hypothetical protein [Streptomyces sp. NPDC001635]
MVREPVIPSTNHQPVAGYVELHDDRDPIVHIPHPHDANRFIEARRSSLQVTMPTPARNLTPQPLLDKYAQRMIGGGIGFGVAAWGGGHLLAGASQLLAAATGFGTTIASIVLMITVARVAAALRKPKTVNITNNNKWGGRSTTRV